MSMAEARKRSLYLTGIFLFCFLSPAAQAFQWTDNLDDGVFVVACVDGNISLPWDFNTLPGEVIQDIRWNFHVTGRQQELVGMYTAGNFLPMPAFSQRVHFVANGGLLLSHVAESDSGNYTAEVAVRDSHNMFTDYLKTAIVEAVAEFHVLQEPEAVYVPGTDSWHVTLSCGTVVNVKSAADVVWRTPFGEMPSTSFQNGRFYLTVPNPIKGGNYSCVLPPSTTATGCLPQSSLHSREVSLYVDEKEARLSLLEAENKDLRKLVKVLNGKAESFEDRLLNATAQLEQMDKGPGSSGTSSKKVSFHASLSASQQVNSGSPILLDRVLLNEGGAYSNATGNFTIPFSGTYFFIATTADASASSSGNHGDMSLIANDVPVCYAYSKFANAVETSTCHVTVHLKAGTRLWLRSDASPGYFYHSFTSFSGFLLHTDD